ncbi:MAG: adenosine deaminase [Verrucomicrobiota bacterium]
MSAELLELRGEDLLKAVSMKELPKVLLHEHLDGGLRPQTVVDLAKECGYDKLPTHDAIELGKWFNEGARRGSLPLYLEGFRHTTAVMLTAGALERVAFEFIEDMFEDGVFYAEIRFAPVFHSEGELSEDEVVEAVLRGLAKGEEKYGVRWGLIICGMRHRTDTEEAAKLAIRFRDRGVVGFDLAGGEAGFPPKKHLDAFHEIRRANFNITIHAGEAYGPESIWQALQYCGAHRLGHGTRLKDDLEIVDGKVVKMGRLAQFVLDQRIPIEVCLTSNVDTGAIESLEEHPFRVLFDNGFRVCLNTDDRLMSATSMSQEFEVAVKTFGLNLDELEKLTMNGIKSAFAPFQERIGLIFDRIQPGYRKIAEGLVS